MHRTAVQLAIYALAVGCAPAGRQITAPSTLLSLYAEAYAAGAIGFSCMPAAYVGGPVRADVANERDKLRLRRLAVRARVASITGESAVEDFERSFQDEAAAIDYRCDPSTVQRSRMRYRSLLSRLERAVGRTST